MSLREPIGFNRIGHVRGAFGSWSQVTGRICIVVFLLGAGHGKQEGAGYQSYKKVFHGEMIPCSCSGSNHYLGLERFWRLVRGLESIILMDVTRFALFILLGLCGFSRAEDKKPLLRFSEDLRQQAEKGDADAQFQIGDCYFFGLGIPQDQVQGVIWYRRAAQAGQMNAQFNLGGCLHEGLGTEANLGEAILWWRRSAGQDYPPAQISIGDAYLFGKGLEQDEEEGVRWYRKAADQNYPAAQHRLGNCYFNGQGVRRDVVQAIQWYRKAADQGYNPSIKALRQLEQ